MKFKILFIITFSILFIANAQSEFTKNFDFNSTNCEFPDSDRARQIYPLGIETFKYKSYSNVAIKIFTEMIEIDSTFCDAYYWAGYTLRRENLNKEALAMYCLADSLSQKPSLEYKQNIASVSMLLGLDSLSRKKYKEIVNYFPNNPEGYYGIALTSTLLGDVDFGLNNIDISITKYDSANKDAFFLKAILLTLNAKHQESLNYYEKVRSNFRKDDNFNGNYALSLYEVATKNNDEKMMKLAHKHYKKVKNKDELTEQIKKLFE
jgi:tetratricopeptide (TPR) repeat protein